MDLVVSPSTVALNPQQGAAVPALRAGDIIEAQVLQLLRADLAKIAIGNMVLEVQTKVALTPGSTVRLAVNNTPEGLRLTLVGTAASPSSSPAAANTPATSAVPGSAPDAPVTGSATAPAASQTTTASPAVVTGGATIATSATTTANTPTGATVTASAAALPPQAPLQDPVAVAAAAVATAVQTSAARQGGLAPLLADAGVAATVPALPEPVRQAAERLLAAQPTLDENISAGGIKQALSRSGLFLEAHLAAAADGAAPAPTAADLKAALVVLRDVLRTWLATDLPSLAGIAVPKSDIAAPIGDTAPQGFAPNSAPDAGAPNATPRAPAAAAAAPPPPYRGAPTAAQPAAAPSISADTAPRDIGRVLLGEADAALARQTLMQAASLPEHLVPNARNDASGPRWLFEVPFASPQGPTVAQFEIARDGHNAPGGAGARPAWRARFSLDVEPIGPVHAQIALIGTRAAVTLWAERPETSAQLRDNAPALTDALRRAELDGGDVLVRVGSPPRPAAVAAGRFLDRAS